MTLLHNAKSKEKDPQKVLSRPMKRKKPDCKAQTISSSDSDSAPQQKQISRGICTTGGESSSGTTLFPTLHKKKTTLIISSSDEEENNATYLGHKKRGIVPNARRRNAAALEDAFSPLEKLKRAIGNPKSTNVYKGKSIQDSRKKH